MVDKYFGFMVGVLFGGLFGGLAAYHGGDARWQKKCIEANVAEWKCDSKTGILEFVFKEPAT